MDRFNLRLRAAATLAALSLASCAPAVAGVSTRPQSEPIRNVILMIADGAGIGAWTAGAFAREKMAVESMPVIGLIETRSASHKVTDSAASATAYATGARASNRTISVGPPERCPVMRRGDPVTWPAGCEATPSWFAAAREKGKATGVLTTAAVVDASTAAFVAHSPSRYFYEMIADQFEEFGLDVMLGGGLRYFAGESRSDGDDLMARLCARADCVTDETELNHYIPGARPLVGLFSEDDMDELPTRPVRVPSMVRAALAKLEQSPNGFVAMFESEATDNAGHGNVPLERMQADILEFDEAVGVALEFARRTPGTLVVVTADHETGGMSLREVERDFEIAYTTPGHSAALVPVFAEGPGAERFAGWHENREIGQIFFEIANGW